MASSKASSKTSASSPSSSSLAPASADPTKLPDADTGKALDKYRESEDARKLVAWVQSEYERAKQARQSKQLQWYINMSYFFGLQWIETTRRTLPNGYADKIMLPRRPYYAQKKVINRTRAFVRTELSKFLSSPPTVVSVPSTAEDQDIRAAFAAEQAWQSISDAKKFRTHFRSAAWWMVVTGNGFIKTYWDNDRTDPLSQQQGDICFGNITPFHLFVPDLREENIEDQPYLINAYVKPVDWVKNYYGDALKGIDISPSVSSANSILEEGYLNLSQGNRQPDSVVLFETWIKPGTTSILPEGGVIHTVDDKLISINRGWPYEHGMYPYTQFSHIPTGTFYADSPLVDTNTLQKEYNTLRSEISEAGRRMARPQLLAAEGSIVPSKMTNEPGLIIQYRPGLPPPQPMPLSPLPEYYVNQMPQVLTDWEDLTGQHDVSRGQAPPGVTAGTAINYLQEKDDQYLTPQYQNVEEGTERVATQTVGLFVQYVDMPRKIKVIGADGAFDTLMLSGADIKNGTDIRVEEGSAVGQSRAAQDAKVMDQFSLGIIDRVEARMLLSSGGAQRSQDLMSVAEKKAQRENIKMKMLDEQIIAKASNEFVMETLSNPEILAQAQITPEQITQDIIDEVAQSAPPVVAVADFDVHQQHIETHNRFRMSQEFEALPQPIQEQFAKHVAEHQRLLMQGQMMNFLQQIPSDGSDGQDPGSFGAPPGDTEAIAGSPEDMGPGATLAGNGAAPEVALQSTGGA